MIDAEYIWKYTHKAYDFSVLGNTPITFPIEWASSKIPGYAIRASVPNFHGFTAFVVMSSVAARFFDAAGQRESALPRRERARVPHRPRRKLQLRPLTCNTSRGKSGPWVGFNWRYDSGLVGPPAQAANRPTDGNPRGRLRADARSAV